MAGKRNQAVVAVISDLTSVQAAQITKEIMVAKSKHAIHARGTIAAGKKEDVGLLIQKGRKQLAKKGV